MTINSVDEFIRLRESDDPAEYNRAADEDAPIGVWEDVVRTRPDMRFWVAQNKTVPLDVLRVLADDEDPRVRSMVAMKRKLDAALFEKLARDVDEGVRQRIAYNAKAPLEVLRILSGDVCTLVADAAKSRLD